MNDYTVCEIMRHARNMPIAIYEHTESPVQISKRHWHQCLEISIVFDGSVDFYNGTKHKRVFANGISLSNLEEMHYSIPNYSVIKPVVVGFTIHIGYEFLKSLIPDINNIYFDLRNQEIENEISVLMKNIYNTYIDDKYEYKNIKILSLVCEILFILSEKCKKNIILHKTINSNKTREILDYIHEHYQENLRQHELAQKYFLSREYFSRFFKKEIGKAFKQYLTEYRLLKSIELLENEKSRISDIALLTGFVSESQFIESFKKYYNTTPNQYRKQVKNYDVKKSQYGHKDIIF